MMIALQESVYVYIKCLLLLSDNCVFNDPKEIEANHLMNSNYCKARKKAIQLNRLMTHLSRQQTLLLIQSYKTGFFRLYYYYSFLQHDPPNSAISHHQQRRLSYHMLQSLLFAYKCRMWFRILQKYMVQALLLVDSKILLRFPAKIFISLLWFQNGAQILNVSCQDMPMDPGIKLRPVPKYSAQAIAIFFCVSL